MTAACRENRLFRDAEIGGPLFTDKDRYSPACAASAALIL